MLLPDSLLPNQRVLLLGIPEPGAIVDVAARLTEGLLVAMGDDAAVREARRACQQIDNVMFVPFDGASIPWQDGFFHHVLDLRTQPAPEIGSEIERVTAATTTRRA